MTRRLTVTVTEAAELVGVSRAKAYDLVQTGEIPCIRFGGRLVVPIIPLLATLGVTLEDWQTLESASAADRARPPGALLP